MEAPSVCRLLAKTRKKKKKKQETNPARVSYLGGAGVGDDVGHKASGHRGGGRHAFVEQLLVVDRNIAFLLRGRPGEGCSEKDG